jgi:transcriptional antiterminator NusG
MKLVDPSKAWYVVRTFSGEESDVADELHKAGFDAYCPTRRVERTHGKTKALIERHHALLPGYLFAAQPNKDGQWDFPTMRETEGVIDILRPSREEPFTRVPANLVVAFQVAEQNMEFDDTRAARIARKEEAETKKETAKLKFPIGTIVGLDENGPMAHVWGEITKHLKSGRVKVELSLFGAKMEVESDIEKLRPAA